MIAGILSNPEPPDEDERAVLMDWIRVMEKDGEMFGLADEDKRKIATARKKLSQR